MPKNSILLPHRTRHGQEVRPCTWPPTTRSTSVALQPQSVLQLLWRQAIDPRGVSSPWAAALAFQWQLESSETAALEILRSILLGQFLDVWEYKEIALGDRSGLLKTILAASLPESATAVSTRLGVFTSRPGGSLPRVVAASVLPRWCIFPSTAVNSGLGREALAQTLLQHHGPDAPDAVLQHDLTFVHPDHDQQFRSALKALALSAQHVADGAYKSALLQLAGSSTPQAGEVPKRLVPVLLKDVEWSCAGHESEGRRWATDGTIPEVVLDRNHDELLCGLHHTPISVAGNSVSLDRLSAATVTISGSDELVIWADGRRSQDLSVVSSDPRAIVLRYRRHGPCIKIVGRVLSLEDIRCQGLPVPKGPDGLATATIPIRPEFVGLIEEASWSPATRSWSVKVRGRGQETLASGTGSDDAGQDAGIVVWPRRRPPGWKTDVVGVFSRADSVALIEKGLHGQYAVGAFAEPPVLVETSDPAAYVAFHDAKGPRGVFPLPARVIPAREAHRAGLLALDFGTSSTTVLYKSAPGAESVFVANGTENLNGSSLLPSKGAQFPTISLVEGGLSVYSGWYEAPSPSPLLGTLVMDRVGAGRTRRSASVIPRDRKLIAQLRQEPSTKVYSDLKWERLDQLERDILELYLRRVLLPAYLSLADDDVGTVLVAATYPLAFESNRLAVFKSALERVLHALQERTGVQTSEPRYFSESHAGISATAQLFADYVLTVDMGGGTTDFALLRGNDGGAICGAESVQLGGRDILKTLRKQQDQEQVLNRLVAEVGAPAGAKLGVSAETLMETLLQSSGINSLVATVRPMHSIAVRQSCVAVLSAIVLTARRLLEAEVEGKQVGQTPTVNVAFLGQAWHLLHPALTQNLTEALVLKTLSAAVAGKYNVQPAGTFAEPRERKLALARGAMTLLEQGATAIETLPSVFLGMRLQTSAGELAASRLISDVPSRTAFPAGDPGFGAVIDALLQTMAAFNVGGLAIGDPGEWLDTAAPGIANLTRRSRMIARGCELLTQELKAGDGSFRRSPLSLFLSGPWREAWLAE
jgi:hypothetical protein